MPLTSGTLLGSYRIVAPIGAGGMGEVYRAHDDRLGRDVAVKILPEAVASDSGRLDRFEREARATAALNHPNIVSVFDIGRTGGLAYVVMELVDGSTLAEELAGRSPTPRKALEWTVGIARGLAAAHARGIVHRDIKPDNLLVTADGRIKILDFGIARFTEAERSATESPTVAASTEPGKVLGTAGYMSPEQVRGETVDARSDIFSLGAVLYEMLAGRRAFTGDTAVETMHAVLKTDPPDLDLAGGSIPPVLDRVVRRCLEKRPDDRFHSAHDLALALEAISSSATRPAAALAAGRGRRGPLAIAVAALVLVGLTAAVATWWASDTSSRPLPTIRQITVRRGTIDAARFRPAGDSVVYSARFAGTPPAPFETRSNSPEAQQVGPDNAMLLAESDGTLALGLAPELYYSRYAATLATLLPGASVARELAPRIVDADFTAEGLAAIEGTGTGYRLHVPLGTVVEESPNLLRALRASPDGEVIAFVSEGEGIVVLGLDGTRTTIDANPTGLAWSPDGERIWFSGWTGRGESTIWSVRPGDDPQPEWRTGGSVVLEDVASDGRLLIRRDESQGGTLVVTPDHADPVDLSWLDQSEAVALSTSADALLLNDAAGFYLRQLDGSPALRLGDGRARDLSSDGQWVVAFVNPTEFTLVPVGIGTSRSLSHPGIESYFAWFHPDGRRLVFNGREDGEPWRFFTMRLDGTGEIGRIGPDNADHYVGQIPVSNDGRWLLAFGLPDRDPTVYALDGEDAMPAFGLEPGEVIIRFAEGDREVFVFNRDGLPVRIDRVDFRTGERRLWREFQPGDPAGIAGFQTVAMSADGRTIAFNYRRVLSTLYVVSGLR